MKREIRIKTDDFTGTSMSELMTEIEKYFDEYQEYFQNIDCHNMGDIEEIAQHILYNDTDYVVIFDDGYVEVENMPEFLDDYRNPLSRNQVETIIPRSLINHLLSKNADFTHRTLNDPDLVEFSASIETPNYTVEVLYYQGTFSVNRLELDELYWTPAGFLVSHSVQVEIEEPAIISRFGGWNLQNDNNWFNWNNTQFPMESKYYAAELAAANDLMMEVETDHEYFQEIIWTMLCEGDVK